MAFDEILNRHKDINCIKLDIEGSELEILENDTEVLASGKVKLKPSGTWHYTIYEQTNNDNLDPDDESVVGTLERGILQVSKATEEVTYNFHTETETNYIHIP